MAVRECPDCQTMNDTVVNGDTCYKCGASLRGDQSTLGGGA